MTTLTKYTTIMLKYSAVQHVTRASSLVATRLEAQVKDTQIKCSQVFCARTEIWISTYIYVYIQSTLKN